MKESLFSAAAVERLDKIAPLAARMRPRTIEEIAGQEHLVGPGAAMRRLIESGKITSAILWGPAGTGKTSLAGIIAGATTSRFTRLSAVTATVSDVRAAISAARDELGASGRRTILFIDEIHRFNRAQQDALLPAVESGEVILIGATTENPYFEVNSPLISRSLVFRLEPLSKEQVLGLLRRALADGERGLGAAVEVGEPVLARIVDRAGGDARAALNSLETLVAAASAAGREAVSEEEALEVLRQPVVRYGEDEHYDLASAFIKSMRGSDADAALVWLARMLEGGEDPKFIARRMVIFASEDVGDADPMALVLASAAAQALLMVGLPEARLNLAHAAIYLARAPKSRACTDAIAAATEDVRSMGEQPVPEHLRSTGRKPRPQGEGFLPPGFAGRRYYRPPGEDPQGGSAAETR